MEQDNHTMLAVLQNTVMHLTETVELMRGDFREWRSGQEKRITLLETDQVRLETQMEHQKRRGMFADVAAFLSAIIAGIFGAVVKQP